MEDSIFQQGERLDRVQKMPESSRMEWMEKELLFWRKIREKLEFTERYIHSITIIESYIRVLELGAGSQFEFARFADAHENQPLPFHDEKPENVFFPFLTDHGQVESAIYSFQASIKKTPNDHIKKYEAELSKTEDNFKKNITQEKAEFTSTLEKLIEDAETSTIEKLKIELEKAKDEIKNTLSATNKLILSQEPISFWEERKAKHRDEATKYKNYVIGASCIFITILAYLTISIQKTNDIYSIAGIPLTIPAEKISIALLLIFTTAAIWLTRVLVKLMLTNLALEIESLERLTMIKTYIVLDKALGEQTQEIRALFYSTLFKPSSNNLADDSTSPEYIRIVEAMLQKKPGS